ncbi:MAG: hypothetical protein IPK78_20045 [Rhodospirillales bacterium]|nr:hypothetical protein [Rhodospirillales bacterium]
MSVEPETQPEPAALAVIETSSSPSGAGAGVIPGDASPAPDAASETRPIDRMQQRPGSEPLAVASASGTEPMATPPIEPRRPMAPRRNIAVAPDPLAVALAAAVRWTSSDDERPDPNAVAPRQRERPGAPAFVPPRETHRREAPAPPGDAPPRVVRAPRAEVVAAKPDHRPAPAPAAERFAGVHIGSVEVQILSPTPVQPPVARPPAVPSAAPAPPLARGLTSAIGLLQS